MAVTLRRLFIGHAAILSSLGLLASGSLIGLTALMLHDSARTVVATEGIRAAGEIQRALLLGEKEKELFRLTGKVIHQEAAEEAAARLQHALTEAARHVDSPAEQRVLDRLAREIGAYFAPGARASSESADPVAAALLTSEDLIDINVADSETSFQRSRTLGHLAIAFGSTLATLVLVGNGLVIASARKWLYRPLRSLRIAIDHLRDGDPSFRLAEDGPAELRSIAMAVNRMVDALAREREARSSLLAALAHDLRNPLNALRVTLYRAALQRGPAAPPVPDVFVVIGSQVDRLARMADDLLDMARLDAGRLDLRLQPTDLRAVAAECVGLYRLVSDRHRLTLLAPDRPILAYCDPDRLAQVLNNLIGNAIKYSPDGGEVRVRLDRDGGDVTIAVADTGPGIDRAEADRVFDAFQRAADVRGRIPGEGLGLWNARRILAAHGGSIGVHSAPGRGATFEVRLPAGLNVHGEPWKEVRAAEAP